MKNFIILLILLIVVFVCGFVSAGGAPEKIQQIPMPTQSKQHFKGQADKTYTSSGWVLNLYITHKGTRSEGSQGILLYQGKAVGGKKGDIKRIPIGTVRHNGSDHERANLWDDSGWQMMTPLVEPFNNSDRIEPGNPRSNIHKVELDN